MGTYKISRRTLNLFLFILRGYKMLATRFSPAPYEWKERENARKRKRGNSQHRGEKQSGEGEEDKEKGEGADRKRKRGADDDKREKGRRQQVRQRVPGSTFVFRRTVLSSRPRALSKTHLICSNVRVRPRSPPPSRRVNRS